MLTLSDQLKSLINEDGTLIPDMEAPFKINVQLCEQLAQRLLGCTLVIRQKKFIIRMLEIYYGGIGDISHDWYRTRFKYKKSKYKERTALQAEQGLKVYVSSPHPQDTYARFDIVAGPEGVPVSFLIRSVWDENFNRVGAAKGSPNTCMSAMGIAPEDHGKLIVYGGNEKEHEFVLNDTHKQIIENRQLNIISGKRINLKADFENRYHLNWNFRLD